MYRSPEQFDGFYTINNISDNDVNKSGIDDFDGVLRSDHEVSDPFSEKKRLEDLDVIHLFRTFLWFSKKNTRKYN